jgi:cobalt-zinc-cadmium efflux system protein
MAVILGSTCFPLEAAAQIVRSTPLSVNPLGASIGLPLATPSPLTNQELSLSPPTLAVGSIPAPLDPLPFQAVAVNGVAAIAANVNVMGTHAIAIKPVMKPQPPQATPQKNALQQLYLESRIIVPSADEPPSQPVIPASASRRRALPTRFNSRLARWSGAAAVWSLYHDGVLVQRYAARLNDQSLTPARRSSSARLLASLGRVEAVPSLGWAFDHDPSEHVRRSALEALLHLTSAAEPKLLRTLKQNPRPGSRAAAASTLSFLVRHRESLEAVESLAAAGMLDPSEDVRLAAIGSLSLAMSPKALASLEWMLAHEPRPHMKSSLELAVAESRRRSQGLALQSYRPEQDEELSDTRGPLHEVALKRAIAVASIFVAVELAGGFLTGNVALKADSMHLAADQLINGAALFSIWMSRRPPNSRKSYGYLKVESVVGLLGAAAIAFMGFEMGLEAWRHLFNPGAAVTWSVALFALASLGANLCSALILWRHHGESLSMKGAFLHSLTDAIGSFGVIVSVAAAVLLGWAWVTPVATALIVALIAKTAWGLGKPAWDVLLDAVPAGTDLDRIEADLLAIPAELADDGADGHGLYPRGDEPRRGARVREGAAAREAWDQARDRAGSNDSLTDDGRGRLTLPGKTLTLKRYDGEEQILARACPPRAVRAPLRAGRERRLVAHGARVQRGDAAAERIRAEESRHGRTSL